MKTHLIRTTVVLGLVGAGACGGSEPGAFPREAEPVDVVVSSPLRGPVAETFAGEVTSERRAEIATRISGTVRAVHARIGSRVRSGDPVISLDASDVEGRLAAARAALDLAEKEHGRIERLARDRAASVQELDRSTAALAAARAALAEARTQRDYAVVVAPFDGVVTTRSVDPGDLAAPGRPLLTLVDPTRIHVAAELPAAMLTRVREGSEMEIEVPGLDELFPARVERISPAVERGARTFKVEATPETRLEGAHPGTYVRLRVPGDDAASRWIPSDAVVRRGQLRGVFVLEGDRIRLRWVRLGLERATAVELLSGPSADASVVRRPSGGLLDGTPVDDVREEIWTLLPAFPDDRSDERGREGASSSGASPAPDGVPGARAGGA